MTRSMPQIAVAGRSRVTSDRDFCVAVLPAVSRTFALSIEMLPDALRDAVRVAYLMCRVVDTIEDEPAIRPAKRTELFDAFDALMSRDDVDPERFAALCSRSRLAEQAPEGSLRRGAAALFREFRSLTRSQRDAIRPHVLEMSAGMRRTCARADAAGGVFRLDDVADLERYCYYVAGTVGELLTGLFEDAVPELPQANREGVRARAVSFGIGLQLVNIVKDVAGDFERGACYLPQELADRHGLPLARLLDPDAHEAGLSVVRAVCATAREHLQSAREYVALWPAEPSATRDDASFGVRLFCAVPLALALATLREVEEGHDTLRAGAKPKISRATVLSIVEDAGTSAGSDIELARMFDRCLGATERSAQGVRS
jgi:farnesyl-diphosphate farnesyltransferase